ncbi:MAG TPA: 1-(5-phosphoribosyl)-5-[(5-phosphoribosylamino)methylideneamino]imidazole-4-carboxamide isomerase [Dehalococcoidales bacterium]|nr:1-(5-phosphoribosyl)-5-[(5-phosphoribosylamino)methylideneamino]imidazole-4-carboxamide isomerase [Dehalococcoidales bacterium]
MEVIPSIDIKDGKCVRLYQGDYNRETVFSDDPLDVAFKWQSLGAPRIHIIDLDGAATGEIKNLSIIKDIARAMLIPVQVGGGIRHVETVNLLLKAGVERAILGTIAVEQPALVADACRHYGESIIVAIDARDGLVATRGWVQSTGQKALALAKAMAQLGVKRFIYTDIARDGTLTEPNITAITEMVENAGAPVIAAGGISTITHLKIIAKVGAEGAIIGKALYTGDIKLKQAITEIAEATEIKPGKDDRRP